MQGNDEKLRIGPQDRPTSFDIAYRAGVSQSTVSRALRGDPNVSEETRRRIESIAHQLNYRVDKNASNLRFQHTNTLALLFFEDPTSDASLINPFFLSMLGSITRACARRGYDLLISFQKFSQSWNVDYEAAGKADGLILLGYGDYLTYREHLRTTGRTGNPFRPLGRRGRSDNPDCRSAAIISRAGTMRPSSARARPQQNRFPRRGLESLSGIHAERNRGYSQALASAGFSPSPILQVDAISTEQSGYEAARTLIGRR